MAEILNNPVVTSAAKQREALLKLGGRFIERWMDTIPWRDMSAVQRKMCIAHAVSQVETEEELDRRLQSDFGVHACINWYLPEPGDQTGMEARMFVQALGGLVSKNGAIVMIMTHDGSF